MSNRQLPEMIFDSSVQFHELVHALIEWPELYSHMKQNPEDANEAVKLALQTVEDYKAGKEAAYYSLHRALDLLYSINIHPMEQKPVFNQYDPTLMRIQKELEEAWEAYEDSRFPDIDIPTDTKEFQRWFMRTILDHEAANHQLYAYLEGSCSREEMSYFFSQEITVDSRFDDLVALAQIGTSEVIKMELAENYWDEMGNGEMDKVHTVMFNYLLDELGLLNDTNTLSLVEGASWQSLAVGNTLLYSALYRKNLYRALGCLGAVELVAPKRFSRLVKGFKRLGISEKGREYHTLHIQIDTRHGHGWVKNAIVPIIKDNPEARIEIVKGAFLRLNTSMDYCNKIYERFSKVSV